ncbi:MAG: glycosyltransferase, partial [Candidatus Delongbacteria bacterium]|nr:glycosyltransferase [Candidatus Delongbacteria bacterium]MDD4205156.1 glycosyltransferase [Candidatus Delongbacteria bacterium]
MKYILTGGGTGGHVYPALAIAEQIKKNEPDAEFLYLGTKDHIEAKIVPAKGYKMKFIRSTGMPGRKLSFSMIKFALSVFAGTLKSIFIVLAYKPDMIIGSGGFVSAPPIFAGHILRKLKLSKTKMFLHEANAEAGKLVKFAGPMCDGVGVSYMISLKDFPVNGKFVGYPVREEFFNGSKDESRQKLGIEPGKFVVFAVGGSQGARTINRAVADSLLYLKGTKDLLIFHVTGRGTGEYNGILDTIKRLEKNSLKESELGFYKRLDYAENIKDYYFAADLIITRGGGTINEIAVCGTPSLIIPKANLSGDHQVMNAISMKNSGAADIIYEEVMPEGEKLLIKVEGRILSDRIKHYMDNCSYLTRMSKKAVNSVIKNANDEIYDFIKSVREGKMLRSAAETPVQKNPFADKNSFSILNALQKLSAEQIKSSEYYEYISYRSSHYLVSANWNIRNNAVKICGILRDGSKIPLLSRILRDEKKGFIRRNIITAYSKIGSYTETVESDLFFALGDSYWEVRSEALKAVRIYKDGTSSNEKIKERVTGMLESKNFELLLH